jgi:hypothetical protein
MVREDIARKVRPNLHSSFCFLLLWGGPKVGSKWGPTFGGLALVQHGSAGQSGCTFWSPFVGASFFFLWFLLRRVRSKYLRFGRNGFEQMFSEVATWCISI